MNHDEETGEVKQSAPAQQQGIVLSPASQMAAVAQAARAEAEVKAQYFMAMQRPRDRQKAFTRLMLEAERPSFADEAVYELPFGEEKASGLSIRAAEAAVQAWGNCRVVAPVVYDDDNETIREVTATDLETNVTFTQQVIVRKVVERKRVRKGQTVLGTRTNSKGENVYIVAPTDNELLAKDGAITSKAIRTVSLRLLPEDFKTDLLAKCQATNRNEAAKDPAAATKKVALGFAQWGISTEVLAKLVGRQTLEGLTPQEIAKLGGLWKALGNGEITQDDLLQAAGMTPAAEEESPSRADKVHELLSKRRQKTEAPPAGG